MDKKTLVYAGIVVAVIIVVVIVISVTVNMFMPKYLNYSEVEEKLVNAAKMYYQNHQNFLPTTDGMSTSVRMEALVNESLIDPLDELIKGGEECSAEVLVTFTIGEHTYIPYLTCPDYTSIELHKVVNDPKNLVNEGKGLYYENSEYVFKGEVTNNYVSIDGKLWRIVKTDISNNMLLVLDEILEYKTWDNRFNSENNSNNGINDYNISRMKEYLDSVFAGEALFSESSKSKMLSTNWCIGKRSKTETTKDNNIECKTLSQDKSYLGLLTVSEIIRPSLDPECKTTVDRACVNYNYLTVKPSGIWSLTPSPDNTAYVYGLSQNGIYEAYASFSMGIKMAVYLNNRTMFQDGAGTIENPYILR